MQKPRLVVALARPEIGDLRLYRIEIVPSPLAEKPQPHLQDRGPDAPPPIVRVQRQRRPFVRGKKPFDVRTPVAENAEASEPHEGLRRFRGRALMRQNPGHLKSLRGGGAEIARVSVVEQNDDVEFEGVGDESKVLVVEVPGPADAEGVPEPAAPRLRRGAVDLLHAERAHDPGFGGHGVSAGDLRLIPK